MTATATRELTAEYGRTNSATTRHIIRPEDTTKTLCGQRAALREGFMGDNGGPQMAGAWMVRDLKPCTICERSAAKRGIRAFNPGYGTVEQAHAQAIEINDRNDAADAANAAVVRDEDGSVIMSAPATGLAAATPAEIDTKLAELYRAEQAAQQKIATAAVSLHYALGERAKYVTRSRREWPTTTEQALALCRARGDERIPSMAGVHTYAGKAAAYDTAVAALAAIEAEQAPYHAEYRRRPWSRFFTVQQHNGHIHSGMDCSTCNRGHIPTDFGWNPDLSGLTEEQAVAKLGPTLCTVCFPSAPVEWTAGNAAAALGYCDGSAMDPAPGPVRQYGSRRYGKCTKCNEHPMLNLNGTLRKHKPVE